MEILLDERHAEKEEKKLKRHLSNAFKQNLNTPPLNSNFQKNLKLNKHEDIFTYTMVCIS